MIALKHKADGTTKMTLAPLGNLFSDEVHEIHLTVCGDPMCDCGSAKMYIKKETAETGDMEYIIPINIQKGIVHAASHEKFFAKEEGKEYVTKLFDDSFAIEDWDKLYDSYYDHKFDIINRLDINDFSYEFDSKHYEEHNLLFAYDLAFPCSAFRLMSEGEEYLFMDTYCKNPDCPCTDVLFHIIKSTTDDRDPKIIGSYKHNYEILQKPKIEGDNYELILSKFKTIQQKYPDMNDLLKIRSKNTKALYEKDADRYYHKAPKNRALISIGRNDPCPCGSGKKYKKCCLGK